MIRQPKTARGCRRKLATSKSYDFTRMNVEDTAAALNVSPLAILNMVDAGAPVNPDGTLCLADLVKWHEQATVSLAVSTVIGAMAHG